jgi:superfamily II DNA or RNA helicase
MTADPIRSDGLEKTIYFYCGPRVIKKEYSDVEKHIMKPKIEIIETGFNIHSSLGPIREIEKDDELTSVMIPSQVINMICEDEERNQLIINEIVKKFNEGNNRILVGSGRINHLNKLMEMMPEDLKSEMFLLTGKVSKKNSEKAVKEITKDCKILFVTYQEFQLGVDIPPLNNLFLASPIGGVKQIIGRILRKCEGKQNPLIKDFVDDFSMCRSLFNRRKKVYAEFYPERFQNKKGIQYAK